MTTIMTSSPSPTLKRVDGDTWIFEEQGVRFFLLAGSERALLIDSGMTTRNARELAEAVTDLPLNLLNTHADPDHIGSNAEFDRFYMHPAESVNYYHARGGTGTIEPVWDGDVIDLGGRPLEIIHLPGHTPGSIAVLDITRRRIITGDPIQTGRIFMFGPYREMHAYRLSLKRLSRHVDRFDEIWPSHAQCPVGPELIEQLYDAAGRVMDGEVPGRSEELRGNPITVYDAGPAVFLCDPVDHA